MSSGMVVVRTDAGTRRMTFDEYTTWKAKSGEVHKVAAIHCRPPDGDGATVYEIGGAP